MPCNWNCRIPHAIPAWSTAACTGVRCARSTGRWRGASQRTSSCPWPLSTRPLFKRWNPKKTAHRMLHHPQTSTPSTLIWKCRLYRIPEKPNYALSYPKCVHHVCRSFWSIHECFRDLKSSALLCTYYQSTFIHLDIFLLGDCLLHSPQKTTSSFFCDLICISIFWHFSLQLKNPARLCYSPCNFARAILNIILIKGPNMAIVIQGFGFVVHFT